MSRKTLLLIAGSVFGFVVTIITLAILGGKVALDSTTFWPRKTAIIPTSVPQNQHPPVTSNQDFIGEKSHFSFSPDEKYIAFVQNVFEEYGQDWNKYWALKIYEPTTKREKTLVVDDTKMSSYEWLTNETVKLYHNAGTGVRTYLNIQINREIPLFTKDYKDKESDLWTLDTKYAQEVKKAGDAQRLYFESLGD